MNDSGSKQTIKLAVKGFSWNISGSLIRSIVGFFVNIILARLLGPEPFGIIAIALLIVSIGNLVIESGLGSALVQQNEIDKKDIAFVFTIQMIFSITLALMLVFLAPWISLQFGNNTATPIIQVMSIILVFQAFAQVPSALLRRKMKFKQIQTAQVISFFIGYVCVGLPLALLGFGVWSLVTAQILQSGLNALIVFLAAHHSLAISFKGSRPLAAFGIRTLFANIANWIIQNVDTAIVGYKFGATNLGFYSRAYQLNWTPTGIFLSSAQTTLFAATSRLGKTTDTIRIFRGFMSVFAIFFFPLYFLIALESKNIILIIYGLEWLPSATLLVPLAIAMPFIALVGLEGPVLCGLGKPQLEMLAQWLTAILAVAVLIIASTISLEATAWSILFIYIFRLFIMSVMTIKVLSITWMQLSRPILSGILMATISVVVWTLVNLVLSKDISAIIATLIRTLSVLSVWSLILIITRNWLIPDYKLILSMITHHNMEPNIT
ncbi:MAG: hypothetical protein CVU43_00065 [Chloroflexi bacterium HGW-Chloroflexi-5]|jgi:PST family polysaccharide transporter|nr:MAG: hypothetical protein CVU43_00065 [Chloroflexi bacterium HGW-Chloroflexi-5]